MPSNGTKIKIKKEPKAAGLPKPIKVKKEEDRTLHTMEHYIDDRLELVKQIFGTLKPKTITNLAPEFLKSKGMDELEEFCLEELLCLSTKRLKSIINATKCPTDTESSDDSDVERHEEHVSLEEISSDSEIEGKTKKKSSAAGNNDAKKSKKAKTSKPGDDKEEEDGQISVLELLELQARARAIRSQLALEPVTKVELNSDNENEESTEQAKSKSKEKKASSKQPEQPQKPSEADKTEIAKAQKMAPPSSSANKEKSKNKEQGSKNASEPKTGSQRTIKLKRNFRKSNADNNSNDGDLESKSRPTEPPSKREMRSDSPDVIPIVAEPETLLISSSDDEGSEQKSGTAKKQLSREKNSAAEQQPSKPREPEEIEEGEITDNETGAKDQSEHSGTNQETEAADATAGGSLENSNADDRKNDDELVSAAESTMDDSSRQEDTLETSCSQNDISELNAGPSIVSETEIAGKNTSESESLKETVPQTEPRTEDSNAVTSKYSTMEEDPDQEHDAHNNDDDDVISIGGGDLTADLGGDSEESRLSHQNDSNDGSHADKGNDRDNSDAVISLNSSEDENSKLYASESWQSRYMKSSKVNKVLAASRLCKRVRDKLKTSKRASKSSAEKEEEAPKIPKVVFNSKHEDGSLEQYKELLEMSRGK